MTVETKTTQVPQASLPVRLPSFPPDVESALACLHPIFRECLDPDKSRFDVGSPWVMEDTVYATDGCIMVWDAERGDRLAKKLVGAIAGNGKPRLTPDVVRKNIPPWEAYHPDPIDPPSLEDEPVCTACEGKRVHDPHRCECCNAWTVGLACGSCGGTGREERTDGTILKPDGGTILKPGGKTIAPGVLLSFRFVDLLARYKAKLFIPIDPKRTFQLRFKISQSGVEGVVMPLDQSKS